MAGPGGPVWPGDPQAVAFHYEFAAAGFPFFVLDVRTRRDRKRGDLLGAAQWDEFARWLARVAADPRPKFIVSPTPFVPNIHPTLEDRRLGDSWAAFPASRKWLLAMLVEQQVRNVVFLSGDSHFSNVARLDFFTAGGERIDLNAFSITASPLFNPFEGLGRVSSHAVRDSRTDGDAFTFATGNYGEVAMNYTAQCFVEQDNFVAVQLDWDGSRPALQVDILDRYGQPCPRLDAPGSYAQVTL